VVIKLKKWHKLNFKNRNVILNKKYKEENKKQISENHFQQHQVLRKNYHLKVA
jgi:hypothetical protein